MGKDNTLKKFFSNICDWVRSLFTEEEAPATEATINVNPNTGEVENVVETDPKPKVKKDRTPLFWGIVFLACAGICMIPAVWAWLLKLSVLSATIGCYLFIIELVVIGLTFIYTGLF